jgi:hypothetical protein
MISTPDAAEVGVQVARGQVHRLADSRCSTSSSSGARQPGSLGCNAARRSTHDHASSASGRRPPTRARSRRLRDLAAAGAVQVEQPGHRRHAEGVARRGGCAASSRGPARATPLGRRAPAASSGRRKPHSAVDRGERNQHLGLGVRVAVGAHGPSSGIPAASSRAKPSRCLLAVGWACSDSGSSMASTLSRNGRADRGLPHPPQPGSRIGREHVGSVGLVLPPRRPPRALPGGCPPTARPRDRPWARCPPPCDAVDAAPRIGLDGVAQQQHGSGAILGSGDGGRAPVSALRPLVRPQAGRAAESGCGGRLLVPG